MKGLFVIFFTLTIYINCQEKCQFKEKFINHEKIEVFVEEHNRIRNEVALGKIKNHDRKFQSASNMNHISYNQDLATKAQDCAERCPKSNRGCNGLDLGSGVLVFEGETHAGGFDWFPKKVMHEWMSEEESARQIVWGTVTRFGCGRIQSENRSKLREVVVCFYDQKATSSGTPYKYGPTLSKCSHGRQSGYLGLCNNGRRNNFIHQSHTIIDGKDLVNNHKNHKGGKRNHKKQNKKRQHKQSLTQIKEI